MKIIRKIVRDTGGVIQADTGDYIAATYSSRIFGFVDDLKIRIDATQNKIHLREVG